jgi:hypothetical protein
MTMAQFITKIKEIVPELAAAGKNIGDDDLKDCSN